MTYDFDPRPDWLVINSMRNNVYLLDDIPELPRKKRTPGNKGSHCNRRKVKLITPANDILFFESATETARYLGINQKTVSNAILKGYKTKGHTATYV